MSDIQVSDLPDELQPIARIVGIEKAMRYAKLFGGVTIIILASWNDTDDWNDDMNDMVQFFGQKNALKIFSEMKGGYVVLPNCKKLFAKLMAKEIKLARMDGNKVKELARKYGIHQRRIHQIMNTTHVEEAKSRQTGLF